MDSWYYVAADGQRHGPLPASHLRTLAGQGVVGAQTLVWRDGLAQWCPMGELAGELGLPAPGVPPGPALPPADPYAAPQVSPGAATAASVPPVPTHLVWAILSTLFCCWPLGVVAIVHACRVDRYRAAGDLAGALDASRKAGLWALWSALSVVIILVAFFGLAALGELVK